MVNYFLKSVKSESSVDRLPSYNKEYQLLER